MDIWNNHQWKGQYIYIAGYSFMYDNCCMFPLSVFNTAVT